MLTTHVGALHRPVDLQEIILLAQSGAPHDERALAARLRSAVAEVVQRQLDLGIDVVSDGEYSKSGWTSYVLERMNGLALQPLLKGTMRSTSRDRSDFKQFYADLDAHTFYLEPAELKAFVAMSGNSVVCRGPIEYSQKGRNALRADIENLRLAVRASGVEEAFLPVVGPGSIQPYIRDEYYGTPERLFEALATALRTEYETIVSAGLVCQIDDAFLPWEWDRRSLEAGWDMRAYRRWAELAVEALNTAIKGLPTEQLRYHICWGSWNGPHSTDVPLRQIVDLVLRVNVQAYLIEAANCRHEFEYHVWEEVRLPDGKVLVPGVIEHATHVVEHPETVADRILRFAKIVGRENVIAGTDCGMRSRSHPQVAWAKLQSLSEGARLASQRLWN